MLNLDHIDLRYKPYPIGLIAPAMDEALYADCLTHFPAVNLFQYMPHLGHKYSLSERNNPRIYERVVRDVPVWRELHGFIKSPEFIRRVLDLLRTHRIDIGIKRHPIPLTRHLAVVFKDIARGRFPVLDARLTARFEFSMLPAKGGCIAPHTDNRDKLITLVVSMATPGEWQEEWGGGTDINEPVDETEIYDQLNRKEIPFEGVRVLGTYPFRPNQTVLFVKTYNSWHSVQPMRSSKEDVMRRTLTINIEARDQG